MTNKELADKLRYYSDIAYGYHMNYEVLGQPVVEFEDILYEAVKKLSDIEDRTENEN